MEAKGVDERFYTPRGSARRSTGSEDERFVSPRESARSVSSSDDAEFVTPRETPPSSRSRLSVEAKRGEQPASEFKVPPAPDNDVFSAARHNRVDSVAYMLDQGVGINVRDEQGNTILLVACQNGLKRMAKLALRRGANINAQNYRGNTALHFCFAYGYGDSLGEYLISKGADTRILNRDGGACYDGIGPCASARK